jgi:trehalose 6-phosphate synthase/phosphatase
VSTEPPPARERRLVVVSNRLPVTFTATAESYTFTPSSGGLAAALAGLPRDDDFAWVGWLGDTVRRAQRETVSAELAKQRLFPVYLSAEQERLFYRGACNEVFWPLFHYFIGRVEFTPEAWAAYVEVNELFADAVLAACGEDPATVWVHDFQLMLLPQILRLRRPQLAIGFFLHIPFPSSEVYRVLPVREKVLEGLLGADQVAFHTSDYALHFRRACLRVLGLPSAREEIEFEGRRVAIEVHPIGPDIAHFAKVLDEPATQTHLDELARHYAGKQLVLGVERLDYSKGVPLKLDTFERYLAQDPARAERVTLLQVIVPSRLNHPEYQQLKTKIEQRVAEINGRFARPGVVPVEYVHRNLPPHELAALYRFADAAMVTPMRDGMNLVAQEFVFCQRDRKGMLLLSEFAGAAHVLSSAILVNPWNVERTAAALHEALHMDGAERSARMAAMAARVAAQGCEVWAQRCLGGLAQAVARRRSENAPRPLDEPAFTAIVHRGAQAPQRHLMLDYDGTLRELTASPSLAQPTPALLTLLNDLAALPRTTVHVITGRDRDTITHWLGALPLRLCAEHGYVVRPPGGSWVVPTEVDLSWLPRVQQLLEQVTADVPHSFVETKTASIAWHYRLADLDYGPWRARELQHTLEQLLANEPAEVLMVRAAIEVRAAGVNKGQYARGVLAEVPPGTLVLAMGDDRTDNDLFRALPEDAVTIQVGSRHALSARYALSAPAAARAMLHRLLAAWR